MQDTKRLQRRVNSGYINIVSAKQGEHLRAFWAHPEIGGTFPGLVLLHEWWGLTHQICTSVRRFAEMGYYVIAPDLFDGKTAATAPEAYALFQEQRDACPDRVDAALKALENHNRLNGKIGVAGWQMGGELAYDAACKPTGLYAAVVFYGRPDHFLTEFAHCQTPILAFYGYHDTSANLQSLIRLRDALMNAPAQGDVIIYPEATAGFFNEDLSTYHPEAAADAWGKTLDFLEKHLTINTVNTQAPT